MTRADRFWRHVEKTDGCWMWRGCLGQNGYGHVKGVGDKIRSTHRVAWELARGPIPVGMHVCHRCDVRACVNPDHLFLGTARDNARDMARKGRCKEQRGERNTHAKLTTEDVIAIRNMANTTTCRSIGARFGISDSHASGIIRRKWWKHVA